MNILLLISQLPYPADTGAKIRTFNLIKHLSKRHSITLVSFGDFGKEADKISNLRQFCREIELALKKQINDYMLAFKNLFSNYPYSVSKYYSGEISNLISKLLQAEKFDLIHCDSVQMSLNVLKFKNTPKILTEHNIESQIIKRLSENEPNVFKRAYFYIQYLKLKNYEIFAAKRFDRVVTVSEEDKRFLAKYIPDGNISVVPNGVDTEYFKRNTHDAIGNTPNEDSIIFTGSMDWLPNEDAVLYFCNEILPLIWQKNAGVKFYVVGRNPSAKITEFGKKDHRIIVTGTVDDVRPYMEKSKVFVAPLRIGGGTRLKILEAMAMEKAVISTSVGCEGLNVENGKNIVIVDKPDEFSARTVELLQNRELRTSLAVSGRALSEEKYDYKIVSKALDIAWDITAKAKIPILLYHDIREDSFDIKKLEPRLGPYIIKRSDFETQMQWLAKSAKPAMIVFDDGWKSNYEIAYSVLKQHGLSATFFVTIENIGKPEMMTWDQLREMANNDMKIGSHSLTHKIPVSLNAKELEYELSESKKLLEEKLKIPIDYFSSPTGFYNPIMPEVAKNIGYKAVLISNTSLSSPNDFILNKTSIKRSYDFKTFISIVEQNPLIFKELNRKQNIRNGFKKALGPKIYDFARTLILRGA